MKGINYVWIIALILIVPVVYASSSIRTGALAPSTAPMCGPYTNNITLIAPDVWNNGTINLTNVNATLIIPGASGLTFLTNQIVNLGNIASLNQSSITPNWTIQCGITLPGNYTLYVNYSSSNGYTGSSIDQAVSLIRVYSTSDSTPPDVLSHSPTNKITSSSATLNVTTDENATCRYSATSNVNYDNMDDIFDTTGETTHKESLTGLTDYTYHYYVKCKDTAGNMAVTDYDASFEVDVAPTAQISLSDPSPVKAGTITITLTTSEDVKPTPVLKYYLDDSSPVNIPLSGSGSSWTGHMVIESSGTNKIGSFEFSGTDLTGNTGTIIASGNTFLVDTTPPSTPTTITAASKTNGGIKLSWYHSEDDVNYYNIYRSTSSGVGKADFHATATTESFTDTSTTAGTTYYYRVSAVDEAGNKGSLSSEVSAESEITKTTSQTTTTTPKLSSVLAVKVDNSINSITELIAEINNIKSDFQTKDPEDIVYLGILQQINNGKSRLENLKNDLEALKSQNLDETTLDNKLKQINVKKEAIKKDIPKNINIIEKKDFEIDATTEDVQTAIYELLKYKRMSKVEENKKQDFIKQNEQLQKLVDVKANAKLIKITYLDETEKEVTLIQKEISIETTESLDLILVEDIPKNVAENVNEIEFKNAGYEVIKKDPLVKWEYNKLEGGLLNYIINKKVNMDDLKNVKSIILFDIDILKKGYGEDTTKTGFDSITGFSALNIKSLASKTKDMALIIIGMLVIGGLLVYYFVFMGEKEITTKMIAPKKPSKNLLNIISKISYRKKDKTTIGLFDHHNYAEEEYSNIGLTNLKNIKSNVLLNKAHKHINNMEFDLANKIYFLVSQHYNASDAGGMWNGLMRLYYKLALCAKINEVHSCVERNDSLNLKYVLNHIAYFYNELSENIAEDEMELMSYAWKQHSIHSRKLINLDRELHYRKTDKEGGFYEKN